ncbi:MAG: glutathione S-transferase family protein [Alphaproteobacteria bacterium]|nr:glutathione S-transferase family protein [Alphaproteobacteria bacterium]
MTLTIYGATLSRAARVLWMAKELGLDFRSVQISPDDTHVPELLRVNPNGRIPAIDDGGVLLFESLAINLYLLKKHGGPLLPDNISDEGRMVQWSFWAMTELEGPLVQLLLNVIRPETISPADVAAATEKLPHVLRVLEGALTGREYLLGSAFTGADLNVASVLSYLKTIVNYDFGSFPNISAWTSRCLGRPAFSAAAAVTAS